MTDTLDNSIKTNAEGPAKAGGDAFLLVTPPSAGSGRVFGWRALALD
jgi:hypothetical protein